MSVTSHVVKYLSGYKKFEQVCISEGIPSQDVLMLWVAFKIRDVGDAMPIIE